MKKRYKYTLGALGIAFGVIVAVLVLSIILAIIAQAFGEWASICIIFLGLIVFAGIIGYQVGKDMEKFDDIFKRKK